MTLNAYCTSLAEAAAQAGAWALDNSGVVRNEQDGLQKELRRAARVLRRCARAAERKMCAGVFGPSQAGKSYLISALARDDKGTLMARFGSDLHDFISEINPEGGKESTGLVTRFTMTRPSALPDGHPVQVRLLTETDLVKIIANTYYADCEHKETPRPEPIRELLNKLEKRVGAGAAHMNVDAMEDLHEYVVKDFRAKPRVQELERSYWERAIELGSKLGLDDRVLLYSLLWDEVEPFTELLRMLVRGLEALGYADEAFCGLEALIPRDGSIIDVATLGSLGEGNDAPASLHVVTMAGAAADLPRAIVTALTAELSIVMDTKPDDYFDHTDLLDFPGYRSRYKFDDVRRELEKTDIRKELFLRGKVAYLFQRYCAERELTSMLLCIGPGPQEVQDLPGVINDWILSTHGEQPDLRVNKPESLFFVLTKLDDDFKQTAGSPSVEKRWDTRLHASLLDFFGKQHDWPVDWDGTHRFNNVFLLRNPNFRFDAVLQYDSEGREIGIRPEMQRYVAELEAAFLKSELVAEHFKHPRTAWDVAMRLNDGGISLIRESLRPLCNPLIKENQIRDAVEQLRLRLAARLKAFYKNDDKEEERKAKLQFVNQLYKILGELERRHQRLGLLLNSFTVNDEIIYGLHAEAERRFRTLPDEELSLNANITTQAAFVTEDDLANPFGMTEDDLANPFASSTAVETSGSEAGAERSLHKDEAAFFAECVEQAWIAQLHAFADNPSMQTYFMFPQRELTALVGELALGAARLDLRGAMARAFRDASNYANMRKEFAVRQQAAMAANIINSFVNWLGRNPRLLSESEREVYVGKQLHTLFTPPPAVTGMPTLSETPSNYVMAWYADWLHALYAMIMENVDFDGESSVNREQNMRLGRILTCFAEV